MKGEIDKERTLWDLLLQTISSLIWYVIPALCLIALRVGNRLIIETILAFFVFKILLQNGLFAARVILDEEKVV